MRNLKYSGTDWLGMVPESWSIEKTKYHFYNEKTIVGIYVDDYERLALTMKGVVKRSKEDANGLQPEKFDSYQILRKNELVFKLIDLQNVSTSRVGLSPYDGLVSPAYIILKANGKILPEFAEKYFSFLWRNEIFNFLGNDGVRSSLNVTDLLNLPIVVPPIKEQKSIVEFLNKKCHEIDSVIDGFQNEIRNLKSYRESIIAEAVTKGIKQNDMKASGIAWCPSIPITWNAYSPKALFSLRNQRASEGERQLTASQEYGIIYQDEFMEMTGNKVVTVEKDFSILKHVEPNDFVISMRSFQGGLEYSELSGSISSAYVMLIPNMEKVYPPFYRWFFKSSKYINALQSTTNLVRDGQAMRYANFVKVPLFDIPIEEQVEISSYLDDKVSRVDEIISQKNKEISTLMEYKKSLVYEYVTGKKEVPANEG